MSREHSEFDYSSKEPVKEAVTKSGPAGLLLISFLVVAVIAIVVLGLWWALR